MSRRGFLSFGSVVTDINAIIDRYPNEDQAAIVLDRTWTTGGPAFNAPAMLRRLDPSLPAQIQSLIGDDSNGAVVRSSLEDAGIDPAGLKWTKDAEQCHTEVMSSQASGRRTFFLRYGTASLLTPEHLDLAGSSARIFHCGACGLHEQLDRMSADNRSNGWTQVLEKAREAGMRTNMEMVFADPDLQRRVVRPCLPFLDSIIINEVEGEGVAGIPIRTSGKLDWNAAEAACIRLCELGVRRLASIHFPEGGVAADGKGGVWRQASVLWPKSRVTSAVGCGDAFAAGLLYGLHEGWPAERGLELAVATAAVCLSSLDTVSAIGTWQECLAEAEKYGHRDVPT